MIDINKDNPVHLRFAVLAVDIVLFVIKENELYVRLVSVDRPPYFPKGSRGFPGGLIDPSETAEDAVTRHLRDKALINPEKIHFEQLYTFSTIDRDPRGRVVAVSYIALAPWEELSAMEQQNSPQSYWCKVSEAIGLAYDHDEMLAVAMERLRSRVKNTTIIGKFFPNEFTLGDLERAYSVILEEPVDKRNFRKKIIKLDILEELPHMQTGERFRPAKLYRLKKPDVCEIEII